MKLYNYRTVENYIENTATISDVDIISGCLVDTYICYHDNGTIEAFEETYINEWSSGLARHIYRSGKLPNRFVEALEEQAKAEDAYNRHLIACSGVTSF